MSQARLLDTTRRLIRRATNSHIQRIIEKSQPVDIAFVIGRLSERELKLFFKELVKNPERAADIISHLEPEVAGDVLPRLEVDDLAKMFSNLMADDAAVLLRALPESLREAILQRMKEDAEYVEALLVYDPKTAGGIMVPDYFSLDRSITAKEAIEALQKSADDAEMAFYVYCVDAEGHLVGVVSLRQLLTNPPDTPLENIMNPDVIKVGPDVHQEQVARLVARYDLLVVPVVDPYNKMLGIVTVDDIIDVVREEATEDFLKMAGAGEDVLESGTLRSARLRAPWVALAAVGGILGATLITAFRERIEAVPLLAAFIPVVMGMGGNIGTQTATIMVRGLSTGRVALRGQWKVLAKEVRTGLLLALFGALLVGAAALVLGSFDALFSLAVGGAILANMASAALLGTLVPLLFRKINVDPAVATGPIMTTFMDVVGILIYFGFGVLFLAV